jgi:hypothetical protein
MCPEDHRNHSLRRVCVSQFEQLVAQFERFHPRSKVSTTDSLISMAFAASWPSSRRRRPRRIGPSSGSILDIRFTDDPLKQQPHALSAALMSTLRQAIAESARRQARIVEEHLGDDLNLVDQVPEAQAEVFGTTVEELRSKMTEGVTRPDEPRAGDREMPKSKARRAASASA